MLPDKQIIKQTKTFFQNFQKLYFLAPPIYKHGPIRFGMNDGYTSCVVFCIKYNKFQCSRTKDKKEEEIKMFF